MFIADPVSWFYPYRILDLGSRIQKQQQKRGVKKICCHTFFCSHKFPKIENYFIFEMVKNKMWANYQRIIELFTQKLSLSSQKYGFGIRDPEKKPIPDPGSRGQKGTGSRIRIRNTGFTKSLDPGEQYLALKSSDLSSFFCFLLSSMTGARTALLFLEASSRLLAVWPAFFRWIWLCIIRIPWYKQYGFSVGKPNTLCAALPGFCCVSGMFIPYPGSEFFPFRIRILSTPDPGSA